MDLYRLFVFDRSGKQVEEQREFQAKDDSIAEELAAGWRGSRKAELWCAGRQIRSWSVGALRF